MYSTLGNSAIDRAGVRVQGNTYIDQLVPSTINGKLLSVSVYMALGGTLKVKVFRDDGTNYVFVGEQSSAVGLGLNTIAVSIPVTAGDFIAFYSADGQVDCAIAGGSEAYKSGDVTSNSLKTGWTAFTYINSIQGNVFKSPGVLSY